MHNIGGVSAVKFYCTVLSPFPFCVEFSASCNKSFGQTPVLAFLLVL